MIRCGITGHRGVMGRKIQDILGYKFCKFNGDIRNLKEIDLWLSKNEFDLIIHLAAIVPVHFSDNNFKRSNDVNYIGTKNLVDLILKKKKTKWFFFSSTSHVYPLSKYKKKINENHKTKPQSKYGLTKLRAEKYIIKKMNSKIPYCIGRIFSYTDINQSDSYLIPSIYKKISNIKNNKKILFLNLNHFRDFISIKDIVYTIKKLFIKKANGIFNIGSGNSVNLKSIPLLMKKNMKKNISVEFKDFKEKTYLIADIRKIKKLNIKNKRDINTILKDYLKR
jgi:UDP-glucose 4-epimerase